MHFDAICYAKAGKSTRLSKTAIPTLCAYLSNDDDEINDEDDGYPAILSKSLPLYSCPSLLDHTYADFKAIPPDFQFDDIENADQEIIIATENSSELVRSHSFLLHDPYFIFYLYGRKHQPEFWKSPPVNQASIFVSWKVFKIITFGNSWLPQFKNQNYQKVFEIQSKLKSYEEIA